MRKVTLGLANSLDNYIARSDGGADWMRWTKEVADLSAKFMKTVDAILIGRKTYEVMLASGQTAYPGATNYVFSRSKKTISNFRNKLRAGKRKKVQLVSEDAATFVQRLKQTKGKGIVVFGGGELAKDLFEADLIDEIVLNVHPVLLGSGIPLFHQMSRQLDLKLSDVKRLKNGGLILSYQVKH